MTPPLKESTITFKVDHDFAEWLRREAFDLDCSASDVIRRSVLIGMPLLKAVRGLDRLELSDLKSYSDAIIQK